MLEKLTIAFKSLAIVLCILALLPLVQMIFRKLPLEDVQPVTLSTSKETHSTDVQKSADNSKPGKPDSKTKPLPTEIAQRSKRLESSGIFGRTPKPPPMALIGIVDPYAILQTPDGQTGKVKEGETLRGVKVLRVGANRVLVEHDGNTSELSIFSGIGSETLMPDSSNK